MKLIHLFLLASLVGCGATTSSNFNQAPATQEDEREIVRSTIDHIIYTANMRLLELKIEKAKAKGQDRSIIKFQIEYYKDVVKFADQILEKNRGKGKADTGGNYENQKFYQDSYEKIMRDSEALKSESLIFYESLKSQDLVSAHRAAIDYAGDEKTRTKMLSLLGRAYSVLPELDVHKAIRKALEKKGE